MSLKLCKALGQSLMIVGKEFPMKYLIGSSEEALWVVLWIAGKQRPYLLIEMGN